MAATDASELTLSAIQATLADNNMRAITARNIRDAIASALGGYGNIYVSGNATPQVGALDTSTPLKVDAFAVNGLADPNANVVPTVASKKLVVNVAGFYLVSFGLSWTGTAATEYAFGVYVGGVLASNVRAESYATGQRQHVSATGVVQIGAGPVDVDVRALIIQAPAGQTLTVKHGHLQIKRVG